MESSTHARNIKKSVRDELSTIPGSTVIVHPSGHVKVKRDAGIISLWFSLCILLVPCIYLSVSVPVCLSDRLFVVVVYHVTIIAIIHEL